MWNLSPSCTCFYSTFDYLPPTSSLSTSVFLYLMVQFVQYVCVWKYIPLYDLISLCKLWRVILFEFDQTPIGTLRRVPLFKECSLANLALNPFPPFLPGAARELLFEFDQTGINFQILRFCTISGLPKLSSKLLNFFQIFGCIRLKLSDFEYSSDVPTT